MANSIFPTYSGTVVTATTGALLGDGTGGSPLAVNPDGLTIGVNGSNELVVLHGGELPINNAHGDPVVSLDGNDNPLVSGYDYADMISGAVATYGFDAIGQLLLTSGPHAGSAEFYFDQDGDEGALYVVNDSATAGASTSVSIRTTGDAATGSPYLAITAHNGGTTQTTMKTGLNLLGGDEFAMVWDGVTRLQMSADGTTEFDSSVSGDDASFNFVNSAAANDSNAVIYLATRGDFTGGAARFTMRLHDGGAADHRIDLGLNSLGGYELSLSLDSSVLLLAPSVASDAFALGFGASVGADHRGVFGANSMTDFYFGSETPTARVWADKFRPATTYEAADGSVGISTTVTTASLVGKTITFKNGLVTGFA